MYMHSTVLYELIDCSQTKDYFLVLPNRSPYICNDAARSEKQRLYEDWS